MTHDDLPSFSHPATPETNETAASGASGASAPVAVPRPVFSSPDTAWAATAEQADQRAHGHARGAGARRHR